MKWRLVAIAVGCLLLLGKTASAHRIDEYLQATIISLKADEADASMRLIPGVLVAPSVIAAIDSNHDGVFSQREQQAYAQRVLGDLSLTLDGRGVRPQLISYSFPDPAQMREGLGEIQIDYRVALPSGGPTRAFVLMNHHLNPASVYLMNALVPEDRGLQIVAQKRNQSQSIYELDYEQRSSAPSPRNRISAWMGGVQFTSLFRLGMRHIAEGTDHLLFLLVLLLPAPLLAAGSRWDRPASVRQSLLRILSIVTAFTVGHSLTLSLAALNVLHVPEHPIEVMIAVSIFVSALHAMRPLFPGREAWIAAFFGLIHGLAFAATLDRLGLSRWERVGGILSFNLGIEAMQMLVVAAILPSLLLLSSTKAYPGFRFAGAAFAAAASVAWVAERSFQVRTPADTIVNALARHALWAAASLFLFSLGCRYLSTRPPLQESTTPLNLGTDSPSSLPVETTRPRTLCRDELPRLEPFAPAPSRNRPPA